MTYHCSEIVAVHMIPPATSHCPAWESMVMSPLPPQCLIDGHCQSYHFSLCLYCLRKILSGEIWAQKSCDLQSQVRAYRPESSGAGVRACPLRTPAVSLRKHPRNRPSFTWVSLSCLPRVVSELRISGKLHAGVCPFQQER